MYGCECLRVCGRLECLCVSGVWEGRVGCERCLGGWGGIEGLREIECLVGERHPFFWWGGVGWRGREERGAYEGGDGSKDRKGTFIHVVLHESHIGISE